LTAEEKGKPDINLFGPLPNGANAEICKVFFEQLGPYKKKYVDGENIYCASVLEFFCRKFTSEIFTKWLPSYVFTHDIAQISSERLWKND